MAEFKLGRIKFVWKNTWTTATIYYKDDVVRYGGRTYICVIGHTSAVDFNTDLEFSPSKWNLMSDGTDWKGDWTTATFYKLNDLVKYGGSLYLCIDSHTSAATAALGLEIDLAKWQLFAKGLDWKNDWAVSTRYKINDVVAYGGITYVCNFGHTSAATATLGLENDQGYWDEFNEGLEYKGLWVTATRYKLNDIVKYGAGLWICTTQHTSNAFSTDVANWDQFVEGVEFEDNWNSGTTYQQGDIVRYGGNQYIAKSINVNQNPRTATSDWDLFTKGFNYSADWDSTVSYKIGDVVLLNANTYLATTDSPSFSTTATASQAIAPYAFTVGSTTGVVAGMKITFTGTTFGNVLAGANYYVKQVLTSNTLTITTSPGGSVFTPTVGAGSMTARISAMPPNSTYWTRLNSGMYWRGAWLDDVEYFVGDVVRLGANTYICLQNHRSEGDDGSTIGGTGGGIPNSRPDLDSAGLYWNTMAIGTETDVLTTRGDLVYYGGAGPTRLPIGLEGQVLRSDGTDPEWVTLGKVDHVYYVAPTGIDLPAPIHGLTLDKPWKTIRYACEQVEKGPRNPNAKYLLEMNRVFMQREVSEWIDYQVTNNIAPFTSGFIYSQERCERDVGFVIDALIFDIAHGGNVKSRGAANSFVGGLSESETVVYGNLGVESDESLAAYNYLLTIIENILDNEAPTTNYQVLNGDNSTAVVPQFIDTDYTSEAGVLTNITSLLTIITDAIDAGVPDDIPDRYSPSNLINVKSGRYREVLPIIVPEQTCILGDEVRSTNAGPAGSLVSRYDAKYSLGALSRLETVLGQIVLGSNVTESSGNSSFQSIQWPLAETAQETIVKRLIRTIEQKIDFNLNTMHLATNTDPTGYNVGYLVGYKDARTLISENKVFISEEISAWLASNYPTLRFGRTAFKKDISYLLDSLIYDLTYDGSTQSLIAGLAYFDGPGGALTIDSTERTPRVAALGRLKTVLGQIISNLPVTKSTGNTSTQWTDTVNLTGGAAAGTFINNNVNISIDLLNANSTTGRPNITVTTITGTNTLTTGSAHGLAAGDLVIPRTTSNGMTANVRYYVISAGLTATDFRLATSYAGSAITITNGSGLTLVFDTEDRPAATNAVTTTTALITAYTTLSAAVNTIVSNMTSYITANFPTLVYDSAKCERDARIILDAVAYDFMFNSNYQTTIAAYSYLRSSASDVFNLGQKAATRAAFTYVKGQAKSNVGGDATAQSRIESLMTTLDDIIYGATYEGSRCIEGDPNTHYARLQIERNRNYIVNEISAYINSTYTTTVTNTTTGTNLITVTSTAWLQRNAAIKFTGTVFGGIVADKVYYVQNVVSATQFKIALSRNASTAFPLNTAAGSCTLALSYNSESCLRDVNSYLDAVKDDLQYPGNYKSLMSARYYSNAVNGSLEEDMYYLRNATGVRNQTLEGLTGDLLPANAYGTSRVSAGAYCSLDPGWGPEDYRTWIIGRSPYVQNVSTFGYAAIGQKIDGALHNGGNDSIVSNDFTQVISDGIGAWITNNGRAELVSVFTYYSHVGYLAENGGRIRGTNGNNSYGDFGSVAEGFDSTETPNTAVVDNRNFNATIGSVFTDGTDEILTYEFENCGSEYTEVTWTISGAGTNAAAIQEEEFRDDAVFNVHLLDNIDDSSNAPEADGNFGGFGYLTNANTAQAGTTTQITIAATDSEISTAYIGMKIYLTGGTGVGQFAIINTYNSGTKIATVIKETTGVGGWDHIVPGTTIAAPDASTTYVIEPRVSFTSPTYSSTARTLATSLTYTGVEYSPLYKTYISVTATGGSGTNARFNVMRRGTKYVVYLNQAGANYTRFNTLTIAGTSLDGTSTTNDITITITSVNSVTGAIQEFDYTGYGAGGNFIAFSSGTRTTNTSTNGTTWTQRLNALPSTSNWTSLAGGKLTVTETAGSFVVGRSYTILTVGSTNFIGIGALSNTIGIVFVATGVGAGSGTATPNAYHLVAVSSSTTVNAYSADGGITWTAGGAMPSSGSWTGVAYGSGRWAAVRSGSTGSAYSTNGGVSWTAGGALPASTTWTSIAYGKGVWVAIASGGTQAASSTDNGVTWTSRTLPSSQNWISVAYGNGRFVAVADTAGTAAAYSLDGVTWTASTITSATYTNVSYGQGVFLAVSRSSQAASSEDGIVWTSRTMSVSTNGFSASAFGNPNQSGIWAAVQRGLANTEASSVLLGATTKARAFVSQEKIFAIRIIEPGSGYSVAPTITITDPNNTFEAPTLVRKGKGCLANPSFTNRGTGYVAASAEVNTGDGYGDFFQFGQFIAVKRLTERPVAGSNVVFGHLPNQTFKLVNVLTFTGSYDGSYKAFLQVSPDMTLFSAPNHEESVTTRLLYSQVRLTGHDFLEIGTGNFDETNYPGGIPDQPVTQANETVESNGGRVFFTSTDQDGNFRVGDLFTIEQSTGVATLNADAFNIAGLQELTLGSVALGGGSATITEFSTDPFFTANSDNIIPTQRAIKAYIASQIGGGGASLNVNSVTSGFIYIASNEITTTTGSAIQMNATFNFTAGVRGLPLAWSYFK